MPEDPGLQNPASGSTRDHWKTLNAWKGNVQDETLNIGDGVTHDASCEFTDGQGRLTAEFKVEGWPRMPAAFSGSRALAEGWRSPRILHVTQLAGDASWISSSNWPRFRARPARSALSPTG